MEDVREVTTDNQWVGTTLEVKETGLEEVLKPVDLPEGWHYNFDDTAAAPMTKEVSRQYNMERICRCLLSTCHEGYKSGRLTVSFLEVTIWSCPG